jgi:hypothetical protein
MRPGFVGGWCTLPDGRPRPVRWFVAGLAVGLSLAVALVFLAPAERTGTTMVITTAGKCTDIPPPIWIAPAKPDIQL